VTDAARAAFSELRTAHPGETSYGFSLALTADPPGVTASANTEEGLRRTAERFAANGYGTVDTLSADAPESLRWRASDREHRGVGADRFDEVNTVVTDAVEGRDPDDVIDGLTAELAGAIRDLNREGFFGRGPDRDRVVALVGTLLEHARDVDPATPFARLQAALG
jgi:hypothetical protein